MDPIVLNRFGELLMPFAKDEDTAFAKDIDRPGDFSVGSHKTCRGIVRKHPVSGTHAALVCSICNLRELIPLNIDTPGKLRAEFERRNSA